MSVQQACTGPELVPGVLRGYRTWQMVTEHRMTGSGLDAMVEVVPVLRGNFGQQWDSPVMHATCRRSDADHNQHPAPNTGCKCGVYGYYKNSAIYCDDDQTVVGVIEASGRVLMGEYGFRAQRARIVALAPADPRLLPELAEFIATAMPDVPVFSSFASLLDEFPPDDVSALVGEVPDGAPFAQTLSGQMAALKVHITATAAEFEKAMRQAAAVMAAYGTSMNEMLRAIGAACPQPAIGPDEDPRRRALRLRQRRNTGPQSRYRVDGKRVTTRA